MYNNLAAVLQRIEDCCSEDFGLVNFNGKEFLSVPKTCNNRACDDPDCQKHRGYLHVRNHYAQMEFAKKYIDSPKSYVFTGWRFQPDVSTEFIRERSQFRLKQLFSLLVSQNVHKRNHGLRESPFCIYMEFKLHSDKSLYLHFHVISGSIGNIRFVQSRWGRIVRYEYPIVSPEAIVEYARKYTGKVPVIYEGKKIVGFVSDDKYFQLRYLQVVYKLQMCRYSALRKPCILEFGFASPSEWYVEHILSMEVRKALNKGRPRCEWGYPRDYVPYVDDDHDASSDIPACVKVCSWCPTVEELDALYSVKEVGVRGRCKEKKVSPVDS